MPRYSNANIEKIKKIQRFVRSKKAKGPRNLPVNVQKKILNLLPLRNQRSFINALRNNRGNLLTKDYRMRKALAKARMNKVASEYLKFHKQSKINRTQGLRERMRPHSHVFTLNMNSMRRFGLPIKGNKLIVRHYQPPRMRPRPFMYSNKVTFMIDGQHVYELPNFTWTPHPNGMGGRIELHSLNNPKYIGYVPKEILNNLRRTAN